MTSFYLPKLGNWPTPRLDVRVGLFAAGDNVVLEDR